MLDEFCEEYDLHGQDWLKTEEVKGFNPPQRKRLIDTICGMFPQEPGNLPGSSPVFPEQYKEKEAAQDQPINCILLKEISDPAASNKLIIFPLE